MKRYRYVVLDPTGNLTCLVLDRVAEGERPEVTGRLLDRCEQVGYLTAPRGEGRARLEMMGGEFCGNASMAAAAYLARQGGAAEETEVPLEVSGAEGEVRCTVRPRPDGLWEGRVAMPPIREIRPADLPGCRAALVRMEGIAHLIPEDASMGGPEAEALLRRAASRLSEEAVGLLLWDGERRFMRPLVLVKKSDTLVWETGCGSGSTALGAYLALCRGEGVTRTPIRQPGGTITAEAEIRNGRAVRTAITGLVRLGEEETLILP